MGADLTPAWQRAMRARKRVLRWYATATLRNRLRWLFDPSWRVIAKIDARNQGQMAGKDWSFPVSYLGED